MNKSVDNYFIDGCGRCPFGGTPKCKVKNWQEELILLRFIIRECGLVEESKWGVPCYTFQTKNIITLAAFKDYCAISFFKGGLLRDSNNILKKPGENTQKVRLIKFTNVNDVVAITAKIKAYIFEAIEIEKAGLNIESQKPNEYKIAEEFQNKLDTFPKLNSAFKSLTPGRQRAYLIYFSAPKQSKTRVARIDKCISSILNGQGLNK